MSFNYWLTNYYSNLFILKLKREENHPNINFPFTKAARNLTGGFYKLVIERAHPWMMY
ncbi:hypothetical protein DYBT9275_04532 [Dyadobacter sp. CECT 9275]|uniref:Uncharacterized protein n=1 Tax=Dyadobacter helix TaxID=2822344 RepID=A0A916JGQ2_9BACT|nr:hypothetical protein DYBT9275_04532 [Dyadobacter sp. CECT 9275]